MKLLKIVSVIGFSTAMNFISGFLKGKIVALYFGSATLGIWSQASNLFLMCGSISLFGLNQGLVKEIIANDKHEKSSGFAVDALSKSLFFSLGISLIILLTIISRADKVCSIFFNNNLTPGIIIFTAAFLPLQVGGDILGVFLLANKSVKKYALGNILISILGLVMFIVFVAIFKIKGIFYSIGIYGMITFFSFYLISNQLIPGGLSRLFALRRQLLDYTFFKNTVNFGVLRLIQTNTNLVTTILVRSLIIKRIGLVENGFFEALSRISMFYTPLISNLLWSYTFPLYCGNKSNQELNYEVNRFTRLFLILFIPVCIMVMLLGKMFIFFLFSGDFIPVIALFSLWFTFDLLRIVSWPIGLIFIVKDRMRLAAALEFTLSIILLFAVYATLDKYSLYGVMISYVFVYSIFLLIVQMVINRSYAIRFNSRTYLILLISLALIFIAGRETKTLFDYSFIVLTSFIFSRMILDKRERLLVKDVFKRAVNLNL